MTPRLRNPLRRLRLPRPRLPEARFLSHPLVRQGFPLAAVALVAIAALAVILSQVKTNSDRGGVRAFAEFSATRFGCALEPTLGLNVTGCTVTGTKQVTVTFSKSLLGSTAFATRAACCPGGVAATINTPRSVVVVFPRLSRRQVRAKILIP